MMPGIAGIGGMTRSSVTPSLRGSVGTASQTSGASISPTLPAHQSGDVIIVIAGYSVKPGGGGLTASGWTGEAEAWTQSAAGITVFSLTATGSSHTITIDNSANNEVITVHSYVLQDAHGNVEATAAAATADPPSETASWGADANLWIAANTAGAPPSGLPSGFADEVQTLNGSADLTTCRKADPVATLNPGAFTGGSANYASATVVVRPA